MYKKIMFLVALLQVFLLGACSFDASRDTGKLESVSEVPQTKQQEREAFQKTGTLVWKENVEDKPFYSQANNSSYQSKADQFALFSGQVMYFHFYPKKITENAQFSFNIYTGTLQIEVENLDNPDLNTGLTLLASSGLQKFDFASINALGVGNDIQTVKISSEAPVSIFDYEVQIRE